MVFKEVTMKMLYVCSATLLLVCSCCQSKRSVAGAGIPPEQKTAADTGYLSFSEYDRIAPFNILDFYKDTGSTLSGSGNILKRCADWNLDTAGIRKIIQMAVPISGEEWHHDYDVLPCSYDGRLLVKNRLVGFSINAGGTIGLSFRDTSIVFGVRGKDLRLYFPPGPSAE